jgi:S1-C subfamily serine protease
VEVAGVEEGGPAAAAGIRESDLVVAIEGRPVGGVDDLHRFLADWPIGKPIAVTVVRGREKEVRTVVPVETPSAPD